MPNYIAQGMHMTKWLIPTFLFAATIFSSVAAFGFFDVNLFQLIALGIMLIVFLPVAWSFSSTKPMWSTRMFRGWVHWLRRLRAEWVDQRRA